jgi:hypothetical protein
MKLGLGLGIPMAMSASAFDPTTLALQGYWRAPFSASPWAGTASAGSSSGRNISEGTNPPSTGSAVNGYVPASFDGSNDQLLSSIASSNFISSAAYSGWALINVTSIATNDATNLFFNDAFVSSKDNAYWGTALRSSGNVSVWHYDGVLFTGVSTSISTSTWTLVQWKYDGVNLKMRTNGNSWGSTAKGNVSNVTENVRVGGNAFGNFFHGSMLELALTNTALSDTDFDNVLSGLRVRYSLSL